MAASDSVNDVAGWLDERLAAASPDLLRMMVKQFAETLMAAEADTVCGAEYRERSQARVNSRNGYRMRDWDTRAGSIELAIPKLRSGTYFPEWLLEWRRRAEQALVSVVATSYLPRSPARGGPGHLSGPTGRADTRRGSDWSPSPVVTSVGVLNAGSTCRRYPVLPCSFHGEAAHGQRATGNTRWVTRPP